MLTEKQESEPRALAAAQDEIWVTSPDGDLAKGFTLPPGGDSDESADTPKPGRRWRVPRPDYITAGGRDLRLDLIRGFMVFAMVANHLAGDSPLSLLTGGNRFFTSAAEGFVLISGLMTGLVYHRIIRRDGLSAGLSKMLGRAVALYALTVTTTLLFIVFSEKAALPWALRVDLGDPIAFVIGVLTLRQTYFLVDVPLLYTILFLCAPAAFILLDRGKGWVVLTVSALVYVAYQFFPTLVILPWPIERDFTFHFSAWQVLFFAGLWLGYHQARIPVLGSRVTRIGLAVAGIGMIGLIAFFILIRGEVGPASNGVSIYPPGLEDARLWLERYVLAKPELRPGRLVASAITFSLLFLLTTRFWARIQSAIGWLLLPLGQHALYAFTAFIAVAGLFAVITPAISAVAGNPPWLDTAIKVAGVALVLLLVKLRFLMPNSTTRRYWLAAPLVASLAVGALLTQQVAAVGASLARTRGDYGRIAQMVLADLRPGDRVWLDGPDFADAYTAYDPDLARVFPLPALSDDDREAFVDATLAPLAAGAGRIHVLYYGERAADPDGLYERWLAGHAFKAREEWVGDIRFATYAVRSALTHVVAGAVWQGGITLSSARADLSDVGPGDIIPLALDWTASSAPEANYSVLVHLGLPDGAPFAQNDATPVGGFRPTASWRQGESVADQRGVSIPPAIPPGQYTLFVGLYDPATGKRLKLASGADRFALGQVTVR